jgi:hypothetical protein
VENKLIVKYTFFLLALCNLAEVEAQINQIDHIYAACPSPDKLFHFFREQLGLPVVWDRRVKGKYESSAVWIGNVSLEFVRGDSTHPAQFEGIGLEPSQSISDLVSTLDKSKVAHDTSQSLTFTVVDKGNPEEAIGWTSLDLLSILPAETDFYIIAYNNKRRFELNRALANDSLRHLYGGPLGVLFLKEIVICCSNLSLSQKSLKRVPGIKMSGNNHFSFNKGPGIQLIGCAKGSEKRDTGIVKIVLRVRSILTARRYLDLNRMLGEESEKRVDIDPAATGGLFVELVDN